MIDTHVHVVPPCLPGVGPLNPLLERSAEEVAVALRHEMASAGVDRVLAMGSCTASPEDPLGTLTTLAVARSVPGLYAIGIADPTHDDAAHFRRVEHALASRQVKALKAYLGYLPYGPDAPGYQRYYELAARHEIPFIFHTGDTYSPRAKLKYARPLLVDDVAVDHPKVRFVMAHLGNPWLDDAAEVVYKNVNVWADLSGLAVGGLESFAAAERRDALEDTATGVRRAFRYAERPNRFLYGSDWPLAPMAAYRDFIRTCISEVHHAQVFTENAQALFRI